MINQTEIPALDYYLSTKNFLFKFSGDYQETSSKACKYTPMALDQMTFVLSHKNGVNRGVIRASPTGYVCNLAIMGEDNKK